MEFEKMGKSNLFEKDMPRSKIEHYEGNYTLLFKERIHHPVIKQRLIDNFYEHLSTLDREAFLQANNYLRTPQQAERARKKFVQTITKEKITENFEGLVDEVFGHTEVNYEPQFMNAALSYGLGSPGTIFVRSVDENNNPFTSKQLSMMEAHEKGHGIRMFYGNSNFTKRLLAAFDFSAITEKTADEYRNIVRRARNQLGGRT